MSNSKVIVLQELRKRQWRKTNNVKLGWLRSLKSIYYWALQKKKKKRFLLNIQHGPLQSNCNSTNIRLTMHSKFPPARSGMPKPTLWLLHAWKTKNPPKKQRPVGLFSLFACLCASIIKNIRMLSSQNKRESQAK